MLLVVVVVVVAKSHSRGRIVVDSSEAEPRRTNGCVDAVPAWLPVCLSLHICAICVSDVDVTLGWC